MLYSHVMQSGEVEKNIPQSLWSGGVPSLGLYLSSFALLRTAQSDDQLDCQTKPAAEEFQLTGQMQFSVVRGGYSQGWSRDPPSFNLHLYDKIVPKL